MLMGHTPTPAISPPTFPVIYCLDFGKRDFFPTFMSIVFGISLDFVISLIIKQVGAISLLFLKSSTHITFTFLSSSLCSQIHYWISLCKISNYY